MSWNNFHNRGEILRAVIDTANDRRDGLLPVGVPGVAENFTDNLDLIGALLLKWHARLSGNIESALAREPLDLETAVAAAWRTTAEQMPGVRLVIDRCLEFPESPAMEQTMNRVRKQEWVRLATIAGLANSQDCVAIAAGRRVEERAREGLATSAVETVSTPAPVNCPVTETSFVDRIRAVLAA
ncbi:MAG: hypothetical protein ABIR34_09035 [Marmoricola sp.]